MAGPARECGPALRAAPMPSEVEETNVAEFKVVDVRATGIMPGAVAERLEQVLNEHEAEGWTRNAIQPIIYNSSTTGYLLIIFERD